MSENQQIPVPSPIAQTPPSPARSLPSLQQFMKPPFMVTPSPQRQTSGQPPIEFVYSYNNDRELIVKLDPSCNENIRTRKDYMKTVREAVQIKLNDKMIEEAFLLQKRLNPDKDDGFIIPLNVRAQTKRGLERANLCYPCYKTNNTYKLFFKSQDGGSAITTHLKRHNIERKPTRKKEGNTYRPILPTQTQLSNIFSTQDLTPTLLPNFKLFNNSGLLNQYNLSMLEDNTQVKTPTQENVLQELDNCESRESPLINVISTTPTSDTPPMSIAQKRKHSESCGGATNSSSSGLGILPESPSRFNQSSPDGLLSILRDKLRQGKGLKFLCL